MYKNRLNLLEELSQSNILIKDKEKALDLTTKYSFYLIVNMYNKEFKDEHNLYIDNTTFEEIYALYNFDKNLRTIFLKYILNIELMVKSLMEDTITRQYGDRNYLIEDCFDSCADKNEVRDFIKSINEKISINYKFDSIIKYYMDHHGYVPPWLLMKILTFGSLSKYYALMKQRDRQSISKFFNVSDLIMKQVLKNLNIVRNICAHNDILYSYRGKTRIKFKNLNKYYSNSNNLTTLYMIINIMKIFYEKEEYLVFVEEIYNQITMLEKNLTVIDITIILNRMGYDVQIVEVSKCETDLD